MGGLEGQAESLGLLGTCLSTPHPTPALDSQDDGGRAGAGGKEVASLLPCQRN